MNWGASILLGIVAACTLGGCSKNHSLVHSKMSDRKIEQKIRAELEGVTSLEDRLHLVSSMTDRTGLFFHGHKWHDVSVVPWDSERLEMKIPLGSPRGGMYGIVPTEQVAIRFGVDGHVSHVKRRSPSHRNFDLETAQKLAFKESDFSRPWILSHVLHKGTFFSFNGDAVAVPISKEDSDWLGAIQFGIVVAGTTQVVPEINADPDIGSAILGQKGPASYRPHLAGAYIIDDGENRIYKESWGLGRDLQFVPEIVTEYSFLIKLEPHDGIDIIVEFVPMEAAP